MESRNPLLSKSLYAPANVGVGDAHRWRNVILRMGHKPTVAVITVGSILMSMALTLIISVAVGNIANLALDLVIAFIVPLVVAPLASYYAVGLLFEVEQARALLQMAAIRDNLTGLFNRGYFLARLREEIEHCRNERRALALILIDVDHFKAVNDSFGHAAGDAVLERLGQVLADTLRPHDLIARYGGEEFVALLNGADLGEANGAAERIRATLESMTFQWAEGRGAVTASLGVTFLRDTEDTADALLARADRAMYAAKNAGRNRSVALP